MSDLPHTVVETHNFRKRAAAAGLDEAAIDMIKTSIAEAPLLGDVVRGTGGFRKVRFPLPGKGKSGGVRTIHLFGGEGVPVFLIDVFSKGQKANLSQAERNELKAIAKSIMEEYAE